MKNVINYLTKNLEFMSEDLQSEAKHAIEKLQNGTVAMVQVSIRALKNLARMCELTVSPVSEFIVEDKFQHRAKKGIKMYFYDNFKNWVYNPMQKKKVSLQAQMKLEKFSLTKPMYDTEIQTELGNSKPIPVAMFFPLILGLLSLQPNGEEKDGGLLVNGYANIFHVVLVDNHVVAVRAYWDGDEWDLYSYGLDYGIGWDDGDCFFAPATA